MKWIKKGLIISPNQSIWWTQKYSILPTPVYLELKNVIRVFFASTCKDLFGRVTYIDLDPSDPSIIVSNENNIVLDIGELGSFDDCGVNPSAIIQIKNSWYLYYAGYQRHYRAPFSILSGLATSNDCESFNRLKKVPILERTETELNLRSAPSIYQIGTKFHMWYVSSLGWDQMESGVHKGKLMPLYCLRHADSDDGINWGNISEPLFPHQDNEFGFGRPWIYKNKQNNEYYLFYSVRSREKSYRIGFATSYDCITWNRNDKNIGLDVSTEGWDSEMVCYPAVITVKNKTFMFYNGNNNGETGFGYAELSGEM